VACFNIRYLTNLTIIYFITVFDRSSGHFSFLKTYLLPYLLELSSLLSDLYFSDIVFIFPQVCYVTYLVIFCSYLSLSMTSNLYYVVNSLVTFVPTLISNTAENIDCLFGLILYFCWRYKPVHPIYLLDIANAQGYCWKWC